MILRKSMKLRMSRRKTNEIRYTEIRYTIVLISISLLSLVQIATSPSRAFAQKNITEKPRIIITSATKAGSFYSDDFTISGHVEGAIVEDAAVYVAGQRLSTLSLETHYHNRKKNKFNITIDASEEPELRIVTSSGVTLVEKIDVLDYRS
jgi:hypothetical protein